MNKKEHILFEAIEIGSLSEVQNSLKKGFLSKPVDVNSIDDEGNTPIYYFKTNTL